MGLCGPVDEASGVEEGEGEKWKRAYPETGCDVPHFRRVTAAVGDQEGDDPA